jgi:hypothetical protein
MVKKRIIIRVVVDKESSDPLSVSKNNVVLGKEGVSPLCDWIA